MAFPTDTYEVLHYNMVRAHTTFKLGYENILSRLDEPPKDDLKNFMGYCEAWAEAIDNHHTAEEIVVFPFLTQKLDFSGELEQHKVIHARLDELLAYIRASQSNTATFDAPKMKTMMEALHEPLYEHLDQEVERITSDKMQVFEELALRELNSKLEEYAKSHGNPFLLVPYMMSHTAPEFKGIWPPEMPWVLRKVIIPYAMALRYRGYWKYSPYSMS